MIIFYSGFNSSAATREFMDRCESNVMMTYHDMHKKNEPNRQYQAILDYRRKKRKKGKRK